MGCDVCGSPTPRSRLCKQCATLERAEEQARDVDGDLDQYECIECGKERASLPNSTCWLCRSDDHEEGPDGRPRLISDGGQQTYLDPVDALEIAKEHADEHRVLFHVRHALMYARHRDEIPSSNEESASEPEAVTNGGVDVPPKHDLGQLADPQVDAHLDLWDAIAALERVAWNHVPGVSAAEAAAFQQRLREADDRLRGETDG